jgi:diguanylate cyclase (GGDEF)-like protein/PAS domain S-box-containing protein
MIGFAVDELLGLTPNAFTHPDDFSRADEQQRRLTAGEVSHVRYSTRFLHRDGSVLFGEVSAAYFTDEEDARPNIFVVSVRDVTDQRALLEELEHQALYDELTGLANRTLFEDRLSRARANVARNGGSNVVLMLDLDDFKGVNDTFGHHVGDELLVEFAHRIERVTRTNDTLCRFGGDEFLYLAEEMTGSFEEITDRVLSAVSEPFNVAGNILELRVSIGAVISDTNETDNDELLRNVDTALYEAKRQGKDRVVLFTDDLHERASSRFELMRDLRAAVGTDQLSMKYQPLVNLATGEIVGFEALMRWQHPLHGPIAPDVFIPLAEQTDLIITLGEFAIRTATAEAVSWVASNGSSLYVSVNLSTNQFRDANLLALIDEVLETSGLEAHRLVLEITERAALNDSEQATKVLAHLKQRGVRLALDDFGTGFSSLSRLTWLHPDIIKIDRFFVNEAVHNLASRTLLEAMIFLGRQLNLTVLAEGIETVEQLEDLKNMNCELGQGYLFSRAVSAAEASDMIASESRRNLKRTVASHGASRRS